MPVTVPLGDGSISLDLPDCEVTVAEPAGGDPVDVEAATERALGDPHGDSLASLASPTDRVAVVVTDVTRATPDDVLLDVLLARLQRAGVARERVTVVLGLGLHRPMTDGEIATALGSHADLAVNHDPEQTVTVGEVDATPDPAIVDAPDDEFEDAPDDLPHDETVQVDVHEAVAAADLVLATGMVEPHQYAGFSGGAKTVVVGAGGEPLIGYTHGPDLLARDGVRLGRIGGNPFRDLLDRAGDLAGPDFCVNVTHGPQGILGVSAGAPRRVVADLAEVALDALSVDVSRSYDAVVAGVGAPKDANLYQASRAATYVVLGANNPLRDGGRVVVPAVLPEGAGEGTGEQRFYEWLSTAESPAGLYEAMREGYEPGAQRAFVLARALRSHDVWITNSEYPDLVADCLLRSAGSVPDALEPGSEVLVVPDALNTLLT